MSPPETPLSAACLSWRRRRRAGWAAASQGRSPSAHPGTCGHEGGEVAGRGTAAPRGPSGGGAHLRVSTVVSVKGTPLSSRIMKSLWQDGQCPTLSQSSLAWGRGRGASGQRAGRDPATRRQETGAAPGLRLGTWPVRALDLVPGRGAELREAGGWARAQGWDPGSGAWPLAPYLRPRARGRGGPRELFSE